MPSLTDIPPVGYRFAVYFMSGGVIPNNVDFRFQKVSGLSAKVTTSSIKEGGLNLYEHRLPTGIQYGDLVLERGMTVNYSPLALEFNTTMNLFQFVPGNVLVSLLDEADNPSAGWFFERAYPVEWSVSSLDANSNSILIDTLSLAYARFQVVRI